jgi:hypothetical protein
MRTAALFWGPQNFGWFQMASLVWTHLLHLKSHCYSMSFLLYLFSSHLTQILDLNTVPVEEQFDCNVLHCNHLTITDHQLTRCYKPKGNLTSEWPCMGVSERCGLTSRDHDFIIILFFADYADDESSILHAFQAILMVFLFASKPLRFISGLPDRSSLSYSQLVLSTENQKLFFSHGGMKPSIMS